MYLLGTSNNRDAWPAKKQGRLEELAHRNVEVIPDRVRLVSLLENKRWTLKAETKAGRNRVRHTNGTSVTSN